MDYNALAELLFPHVTDTPAQMEEKFPLRNVPEGAVITRMAPSPTGFVHLGNLVQGLTSERMAHQSGGVLFLRVEDTDAKREVPGAVKVLIETLKHYGIQFDEGATIDGDAGDYGPYRQRSRAGIYHVYAKQLVSQGMAYPCFCTEEELSAMRESRKPPRRPPATTASMLCGATARWKTCRKPCLPAVLGCSVSAAPATSPISSSLTTL